MVLVGRTEDKLLETKSLIAGDATEVSTFPASVVDEPAVKSIAAAVGQWDVLILNAGYISPPGLLAQSPAEEYWKNYEVGFPPSAPTFVIAKHAQVNVKSILIAAQAFIPTANPTTAAIYALTAGAFVFPAKSTVYLSGYLTSKLAQTKLIEYLAVENPNLFCVSVHPGMIDTAILRGSGADPAQLPMDKGKSPLHPADLHVLYDG